MIQKKNKRGKKNEGNQTLQPIGCIDHSSNIPYRIGMVFHSVWPDKFIDDNNLGNAKMHTLDGDDGINGTLSVLYIYSIYIHILRTKWTNARDILRNIYYIYMYYVYYMLASYRYKWDICLLTAFVRSKRNIIVAVAAPCLMM